LWEALDTAAAAASILDDDITVQDVMELWATQPGFPVVNVVEDGADLVLSQSRFLLDPSETSNLEWFVPISMDYPGGYFNDTLPSVWLKPGEAEVRLAVNIDPSAPYVLNVQEKGYYRVSYPESHWRDLLSTLLTSRDSINRLNRAQILDDALNIARASGLSYEVALDLTKALNEER
jgi:aminopeptidase N